MERKYLPTLSELIDRLSIVQLKEVFISEHKSEYAQEIEDICHDIDLLLPDSEKVDANLIRSVVVLAQMNLHIWHNESNYRRGIKDKRLPAVVRIIKLTVWQQSLRIGRLVGNEL